MRTLAPTDVAVGDALPPVDIPITATLIVSGAIASRDFQDVHHDATLARQRGAGDIFMNILTTNGLVGRYVTDWAGPEAILRNVAIRLGSPNYPGDVMRLTGMVERAEGDEVAVSIRGTTALGEHVSGTVTLTLPGKGKP
ncbi:MAG: MaoC family dehydratase [Actinomycetota bacterium]